MKKKEIIEKVKKETFKYKIEMTFNTETFVVETNDLAEAIVSLKPEQLLTEVFITIYKGKNIISQRRVNKLRGKRIFSNPESLDIFLMSVLLT